MHLTGTDYCTLYGIGLVLATVAFVFWPDRRPRNSTPGTKTVWVSRVDPRNRLPFLVTNYFTGACAHCCTPYTGQKRCSCLQPVQRPTLRARLSRRGRSSSAS